MKKKEENTKDKKHLIYGIILLVCGFLWVNSGIFKKVSKETFFMDILLGIILIVVSVFYFIKYKKDKK